MAAQREADPLEGKTLTPQSLEGIDQHSVSMMLKCKQFPDERPEACRRTTIGSRRGSSGANIFWMGVRTLTLYYLFFFPLVASPAWLHRIRLLSTRMTLQFCNKKVLFSFYETAGLTKIIFLLLKLLK